MWISWFFHFRLLGVAVFLGVRVVRLGVPGVSLGSYRIVRVRLGELWISFGSFRLSVFAIGVEGFVRVHLVCPLSWLGFFVFVWIVALGDAEFFGFVWVRNGGL